MRTGYTCNQAGCHTSTLLTVLEEGWSEQRTLDPEGGPFTGKTGHLTLALPNDTTAFSPVTSCVSCHDQTDSATAGGSTTVSGYTFPHSQTPTGSGNTGQDRSWLWMTIAGNAGGTDADFLRTGDDKAKDGACLKCHRDVGDGAGIGLPKAGTIHIAWDATPGSWAEFWVYDSKGTLVRTGYGEYGTGGWTGHFHVRVPVSAEPYAIEILWFDPGYDDQEPHWTYASALVDSEGKVVVVPY